MARARKIISEAKAWRECAEWVDANPGRRKFLCHRLSPWYSYDRDFDNPPTHWPLADMRARLTDHANLRDYDGFAANLSTGSYPRYRHGARPIFCLLMALECEDEARGA